MLFRSWSIIINNNKKLNNELINIENKNNNSNEKIINNNKNNFVNSNKNIEKLKIIIELNYKLNFYDCWNDNL